MRLAAGLAVMIFVADQALKYYVVHVLRLWERLAIDVIPPFLTLRMAWNHGINWLRWVLIGVALAISAAVWIWAARERHKAMVQVSAGLLIGGAIGNVVDRVVYGAVADFLNMSCCGFVNPYAFNIADIAIFAGAIGLALFTGDGKTGTGRRAKGA